MKDEDEKYLKKCQQDNYKASKEVDKWIEYIFIQSHELIEEIEKNNLVNLKNCDNIEKKLELNSQAMHQNNLMLIFLVMEHMQNGL